MRKGRRGRERGRKAAGGAAAGSKRGEGNGKYWWPLSDMRLGEDGGKEEGRGATTVTVMLGRGARRTADYPRGGTGRAGATGERCIPGGEFPSPTFYSA